MDDDEVVFEGSALHKHLKDLCLLDAAEDHPSLPSYEVLGSQLSPTDGSAGVPANTCYKRSWWQQFMYGFGVTSAEVRRMIKNYLQIGQLEEEMLNYLALLVCTKGLLTPDDRLHLYYFSPVFHRMVEEPTLANVISDRETQVHYGLYPSALRNKWLAAVAATATTAILFKKSDLALSYAGKYIEVKGCAAALAVIWAPLLVLVLATYTARFAIRHWYLRSYRQAKEGLLSLAALQMTCLPSAFSAAADAALLISPNATSSSGLSKRIHGELERLYDLLHDTVGYALASVTASPPSPLPGTVAPDIQADMDKWAHTKGMRRDLELHVSALARDVLLAAEKSVNAGESLNTPNLPSTFLSSTDSCSILHVMKTLSESLSTALPHIEVFSKTVTSQVGLLRHCWLYSEEDLKPRQERVSEEVMATSSLTRRLQACMLVLDQLMPGVKKFSSALPPDDETPDGKFRDGILQQYNVFQGKLSKLSEELKLCEFDLEVVGESLTMRKVRLLREPEVGSRPNGEVLRHESAAAGSEEPVSSPNLNIVTLTPYIAEDEFFEASTEGRSDNNEEPTQQEADFEQDEQIRRQAMACNRRVLTELQPILVKKKQEFQLREEKAKNRLKNDFSRHNINYQVQEKIEKPVADGDASIVDDKTLTVIDASSALRDVELPIVAKLQYCVDGSRLRSFAGVAESNDNNQSQLQNSAKNSEKSKCSYNDSQPRLFVENGKSPLQQACWHSISGQLYSASQEFLTKAEDDEPLSDVSLSFAGELLNSFSCNEEYTCEDAALDKWCPDGILSDLIHDANDFNGFSSLSEMLRTADDSTTKNKDGNSFGIITPHDTQNLLSNGNSRSDSSFFDSHCPFKSDSDRSQSTLQNICDSDGISKQPKSENVLSHETFVSEPAQGDGDEESRWNIRVKPRDLKDRLKVMMENQRKELGNSYEIRDDDADSVLGADIERSWGLPSHLAAEAVRLSNKFSAAGEETFRGIGEGEEETFGGMGEGEEETFGGMGEGVEETFGCIKEKKEKEDKTFMGDVVDGNEAFGCVREKPGKFFESVDVDKPVGGRSQVKKECFRKSDKEHTPKEICVRRGDIIKQVRKGEKIENAEQDEKIRFQCLQDSEYKGTCSAEKMQENIHKRRSSHTREGENTITKLAPKSENFEDICQASVL